MATYEISDIHGEYWKFMELLDIIHFSDEDILYLLGDVVDRGKNPVKTLLKMMEMPNVIPIAGNHEQMMLECMLVLINEVKDENSIKEFEEKPEHPKSNLASMGIYIFNWKLLRKKLIADMKDPDSNHDFGKDIIPSLLSDEKKLYAYKFKGYWKDVGTIDSLWEANMDLLSKNNELDLNDPTWKIYTEDATTLPQYIGPDANIRHAFVNQGCVIEGDIQNSVLFTGAKVRKGAKIIDSVLMPGVEVEENAVVTRALVADNVKIGAGAVVGDAKSEHIELISKRVKGVE